MTTVLCNGTEDVSDIPKKHGKKHFPSLHNHQSHSTAVEARRMRRYIPDGYGLDYDFRPHVQYIQPKYSEIGPDWKSKLRWLPSPEAGTSESAQFVEIWPESWRGLRTFPGHKKQSDQYWILYPEGCDATLRCRFSGVHKSTEHCHEERHFFSGSKFLIDRRNGIPAASPGDKSYKSVEYSPDFYKISSTLPAVNFGSTYKRKFDTFIPLVKTNIGLRKNYKETEAHRRINEEVRDVCGLDNWRPATPLICPLVHTTRPR